MRAWLKAAGFVCMGVAVVWPIIGDWTHPKQGGIVPHEHPERAWYAWPARVWAPIALILGGLVVRSVTARFHVIGGSVRSIGGRFRVVGSAESQE